MQEPEFSQFTGFEEIDHTADWAYRVWGQNLTELLLQAAQALYTLAGVQLANEAPISREIQVQGIDSESLLVAWLNELLYFYESENIAFNQFQVVSLEQNNLCVQASGAQVKQWQKYIKAVTYNNLVIKTTPTGLETTLVLDV